METLYAEKLTKKINLFGKTVDVEIPDKIVVYNIRTLMIERIKDGKYIIRIIMEENKTKSKGGGTKQNNMDKLYEDDKYVITTKTVYRKAGGTIKAYFPTEKLVASILVLKLKPRNVVEAVKLARTLYPKQFEKMKDTSIITYLKTAEKIMREADRETIRKMIEKVKIRWR